MDVMFWGFFFKPNLSQSYKKIPVVLFRRGTRRRTVFLTPKNWRREETLEASGYVNCGREIFVYWNTYRSQRKGKQLKVLEANISAKYTFFVINSKRPFKFPQPVGNIFKYCFFFSPVKQTVESQTNSLKTANLHIWVAGTKYSWVFLIKITRQNFSVCAFINQKDANLAFIPSFFSFHFFSLPGFFLITQAHMWRLPMIVCFSPF